MKVDLAGKTVSPAEARLGALVGLGSKERSSFAIRVSNGDDRSNARLLMISESAPDNGSKAFRVAFDTDPVFEFHDCRIRPSVEPSDIRYGQPFSYGSLQSVDGKLAFFGHEEGPRDTNRYYCVETGEALAANADVKIWFARWCIIQSYDDCDGKKRERVIYQYPSKEKAAR